MELTQVISIVTILVTWLLGVLSKRRTFINNKLIPIQNVLIGVIVALIRNNYDRLYFDGTLCSWAFVFTCFYNLYVRIL